MRVWILVFLLILVGCEGDVELSDVATSEPVETTVTLDVTSTTRCVDNKKVSYSYDTTKKKTSFKNITQFSKLSYEVIDYEKVVSYKGYTEYIYYPNSNFVDFSNNFRIKGVYEKLGIAEITDVTTSQSVQILNSGSEDGIFSVERIFPGIRDGYFIENSPNVQNILIEADEIVNVTFDYGVLCHIIAEVAGEVEIMPYFINHAKTVSQKDFVIEHRGKRVYACERVTSLYMSQSVQI